MRSLVASWPAHGGRTTGWNSETSPSSRQLVSLRCRRQAIFGYLIVLLSVGRGAVDGVTKIWRERVSKNPARHLELFDRLASVTRIAQPVLSLFYGKTCAERPPVSPSWRPLCILQHTTSAAAPAGSDRHTPEPPMPDPPSYDVSEYPVLDEEKLDDLAAILPVASIEEFLEMYFTDVDSHLLEIAAAWTGRDFAAVGKFAHGLVSATGNFGAMRASAAARHLETKCRRGDYRDSYSAIGELSGACHEAGQAMRAWLAARRRAASAEAS